MKFMKSANAVHSKYVLCKSTQPVKARCCISQFLHVSCCVKILIDLAYFRLLKKYDHTLRHDWW
jgi:hypothetical protein